MKRRCLLFAVILVFFIPITLSGLIRSETGSRWLLQCVFSIAPGEIAVENIQGRLLDRMVLTGFRYQSNSETVAVKQIDLTWQPYRLLSGTLSVVDLTVNGLDISTIKTKEDEKKPSIIETGVELPVQLDIRNLLVTDLKFIRDSKQLQALDKVQLSIKTEANQLKLLSLLIQSDQVNATAKGVVTLEKDFPLNLQAGWQINAKKNGVWQGDSTVNGDMNKLVFGSRLATPFKFNLQGMVENVLKKPNINIKGDWQNLIWPFAAHPPQIQSPQGHFEMVGLISDYHLTINGQLNQQYVPQAVLVFDGKGGLDAMAVSTLELKSRTGLFQLTGNVAWGDSPAFDLTASGQQFNPAIVIPELPGSLSFSSRIEGNLDPQNLQIAANIGQLTGQIRKQAVQANGKLALTGNQLKIDALRINSGPNKIAVDGLLEQRKGDLEFSLNMPALNTLWPTLGGSLKGSGRLQGGWENPAMRLDAEGKHLKFGQQGLKDLAVNMDYHPDNQKRSALTIVASAFNSGAIQVNKLRITGTGIPQQHTLQADINSSYGTVSALLRGNLVDTRWKADISKLDITPKEGKSWSLKNKLPLRVEKKALGFEVVLSEGCWVQQSASLCVLGWYLANADLNFQLNAKAIPTDILQVYLPNNMVVKSHINGNMAMQRKNNVLTGSYRADTTPIRVFIPNKETLHELQLGASILSGNLNSDKVSADFDINLAGQDYVRGKFVADRNKPQGLSGNLNASVADFSLIKPFIPQLSDIKGLLKADLAVQGSISKPLVAGRIDMSDGLVEMEKIGLHQIDLQAVASGNRSNNIRIQGNATPIILNNPNEGEKISLISKINLDADLHIQDEMAGNFRLAMPANSILSITTKTTKNEIKLGATSLSGDINGKEFSAGLDMVLTEQDYIRGNLHINTGKTQALSAQATAAIREFALLKAFAPQLTTIKGLLKADMTVRGTTQNPLVNGNVQLTDGVLVVDQYGLNIHDIKLHALAPMYKSDHIEINGSAKSGEGFVNLNGTVSLQPELHYPIELALTGKDFEVVKIPEAQVAVSPDLKIALTEQQKKISGRLDVPKAIMAIQDIPENAVKVSEDEIILGEEKLENSKLQSPDIIADIEVKLGKQVSFTGQGLQANLVGNLKVTKTGEKMAMQGNVDMEKAKYKRFGQDLTVRKGRFLFNGPADNPWLDVEAIRLSKNKKVTAVLALTGSLKNPQTRVSSEPALPETEALAYLVTGGPLNQVGKGGDNMLASAALSYGAGKASWFTDKLGIDEFKVEEGAELKDSLLVMGQYLTPDLYVGTRVGMFNKQANLVLKHKLTETISVESQAGTSQRIKLNYEFDGD